MEATDQIAIQVEGIKAQGQSWDDSIRVLRCIPLVLVLILLFGCSSNEPVTEPTSVSSSVAPGSIPTVVDSPTSDPEPVEAVTRNPPATPTFTPALPGDIEQAIQFARLGSSDSLLRLLTTTNGPCVVAPEPNILRPPACPEGAAAGTVVPALVVGGCPDRPLFIDPTITYRVAGFDAGMFGNHLIGILDFGQAPLRYAVLFGFEKVGWLGFNSDGRLIGAGGGGDCAASEFGAFTSQSRWLVGPDWGN